MKSLLVRLFAPISIFFSSLNLFGSAKPVLQVIPSPSPYVVESSAPEEASTPIPTRIAAPTPGSTKKPTPTATPTRTPVATATATPIPTPTPTPRPSYLDSQSLSLVATGNGPLTSRSGRVQINLTGTGNANTTDPNYKIFNFTWSGNLSGLSPNKSYSLQLCFKNNTCTGYSNNDLIATDGSGNATFSMPKSGSNYGGTGFTINRDNPIISVIIIEPAGNFDLNTATLKADYHLSAGF